MNNYGLKKLLKRSTLAVSLIAGGAGAANAQQAATPPAAPREVVVVTGSLIARQDYVANSPIVTIGEDEIQATGVTTLDTLLNEMPQFVPAINMTSNNPSNGGQANVSLRGLGTNRTLVLMNGRRIVPSNSDGTVDINLVPAQLVGSVEVISGGASATYGSDALAGVTNFILRDINGLEVSSSYGITEQDDGETFSLSLASGGDFADGRGHVNFMLSYNDRGEIYNGTRTFAQISGASAASPLGNTIFDTNNLPTLASVTGAVPGSVQGDTFGFNNNGTLFAYRGRRDFQSPGDITYDGFAQPGALFNPNFAFNTGALNYMALPQKRYNAYASANYDINDHIEAYGDFLFTQYESAQELAASPAAGSTTGFRVPVSNPFITPELAGVLATRANPLGSFLLDKRFTALGPRRGAELYDAYQITTGVRGDLPFKDWTWDLYGTYGRVDRTTTQTGNVSRSAVQQLLNATDGGRALCAGGFDWFGDKALSAACQAFIGKTAKNLVVTEQNNVNLTVQGGLFELPAGEVRFAAGANYREDIYNRITDASLSGPITVQPCIATAAYSGAGANLATTACSAFTTVTPAVTNQPPLTGNDIAGFNPSASFGGATDVTEFFAEVLVPVLKDLPAIQELNLTFAGRTSDYSTVGNVEAYKGDFDWTVIDGVRLRGGYQHAVRAPAIGELFAPQLLGFPNIGNPNNGAAGLFSGDPCDIRSGYRSTNGVGGNLAAATNTQVAALCQAQGVAASVLSTYTFTNQQVPGFSGGNPALAEETADSWSLGVVWQPSFDSKWLNFSASLDYYNIELEDAIGSLAANLAISACFNAPATPFNPTYSASNFYCSLFGRNPLNGNIINAQSVNQNLAVAVTSGVDFQVDWKADIGPGTLSAGVIGAWLENYETQSLPGAQFVQFEGSIGNTGTLGSSVGASYPEWKFLATTDYTWGPAKIGLRWQHIGEMVNRNNAADSIPAMGYFDLLGRYDLTDNLQLRFNVNNLFDEQPPLYTPSVQANTDPSTYDVLGRRFTVGATMKF